MVTRCCLLGQREPSARRLRRTELRFGSRHRTSRGHQPQPTVLVHPSVSASTVRDFAAGQAARSNERRLRVGRQRNGDPFGRRVVQEDDGHQHAGCAISWRLAPALNDLLGGQVQVMFAPSASIAHIKAASSALWPSRQRPARIHCRTSERWASCAGYEVSTWSGFGAPGRRRRIVDRLNNAVNAGLDESKLGTTSRPRRHGAAGSPADFGQLIAGDTEKWGKVHPNGQDQGGVHRVKRRSCFGHERENEAEHKRVR